MDRFINYFDWLIREGWQELGAEKKLGFKTTGEEHGLMEWNIENCQASKGNGKNRRQRNQDEKYSQWFRVMWYKSGKF